MNRPAECNPVGKISVTKAIDASGAQPAAGDQFTFQINCPGSANDQTIVLTAPNLGPVSSNNIPTGTVCTVTETGKPGSTTLISYVPNGNTTPPSITVGNGTTVNVTTTNKYKSGRISVTKTIDKTGGTPNAGDQFTFAINCPGTAYDQNITLTYPGTMGPVSTGLIPAGSQCVVTETAKPADTTLISYTPNGNTTPPTITVGDGTTVNVTAKNKYPKNGKISVTKVIDAAGGSAPAGAQFSFGINCTGTTYDQTITLTAPNLGPASTTFIPQGTQCAVTETSLAAGSTLVSYTPNGGSATTPPTVTVGDNTTVAVSVKNIYQQGKISVTKTLDASGGSAPAGAQFSFGIDCPGGTYDQTITLTAPNLGPTSSTNIPSGTQCTVTETSLAAGSTLVSYTPNGGSATTPPTVTIGDNATTVNVTVKNIYQQGKISVTKVIDAAGGSAAAGDQFTFGIDCPGDDIRPGRSC